MERTKEKILKDGLLTKAKRAGRSEVWQYFSDIKEEGKFIDRIICNKCDGIFIYQNGTTGTTTLKRHSDSCSKTVVNSKIQPTIMQCMKPTKKVSFSELDRKQMLNACIDVCVQDLRPLSFVEGVGFRKLMQNIADLGVKHGKLDISGVLPNRNKISSTIKQQADEEIKLLMIELKELHKKQFLCFTTDMWTDPYRKRSYVSITCHFINDEYLLKKCVLGCIRVYIPLKKFRASSR